MLSIVDRRCAWSETGSQEKRKEREGEGRRGGRDMKERKVGSDCGMKGKEV